MANTNEFVSHNNVSLCGKIVKAFRAKRDEVRFEISIGRSAAPVFDEKTGKKRYPFKRDENGKVLSERIVVRFFDRQADELFDTYKVGDYVNVTAVAQTVRNHYDGTSKTDIWGLSMNPKVINGKLINDHNHLDLRGKIVSSNAVNDNLVIVNILTKVEKKFPTGNGSFYVQKYKSITPVGIYRKDGTARELDKNFTKGTWINVKGYLTTVKKETGIDSFKRQVLLRGVKVDVIGVTQPNLDELYSDYMAAKN